MMASFGAYKVGIVINNAMKAIQSGADYLNKEK